MSAPSVYGQPLPRPTDAELEILAVLWNRGPSTVREVHETLSEQKPVGYTTVLKMLQIMGEKGLVRRNEDSRAHVYEPTQPREATQRQLAGDLLDRAFHGSAAELVLGALSARRTTAEELDEIRRMLDQFETERLEKGTNQ